MKRLMVVLMVAGVLAAAFAGVALAQTAPQGTEQTTLEPTEQTALQGNEQTAPQGTLDANSLDGDASGAPGVAGPALAEAKNGPLVFTNYNGDALYTLDPATRRWDYILGIERPGRNPAVTPDGRTVVYSDGSGIYSAPIDGSGTPDQLTPTDPNLSAEYPTVSPSGETVYFWYLGPDGNGIYSVPIEGGDKSPVIQEASQFYGLQITPDGENFVYRDDVGNMYVRSVGGGPATTLYDGCRHTGLTTCGYPTVSPDGTTVAFTDGNAIYKMPFSATGGGTPTMVPGSGAGQGFAGFLTFRLQIDSTLSFSPDGRYIAYNALQPEHEVGDCGVGYCAYSETRWIPVEGGEYSKVWWQSELVATQVVWAPAVSSESSDTTSPEVSSTDPPNNATGVLATANIGATFFEEGSGIDPNSLTNDTFKVVRVKPTGSVTVAGDVSYDEESQTATFTPTSSLAKGLYRATITTGVEDKAGNAQTNDYTWQFATVGPPKR